LQRSLSNRHVFSFRRRHARRGRRLDPRAADKILAVTQGLRRPSIAAAAFMNEPTLRSICVSQAATCQAYARRPRRLPGPFLNTKSARTILRVPRRGCGIHVGCRPHETISLDDILAATVPRSRCRSPITLRSHLQPLGIGPAAARRIKPTAASPKTVSRRSDNIAIFYAALRDQYRARQAPLEH